MPGKTASAAERVDKQDFYLYQTLKEIHAHVQSETQRLKKLNLLLVLNTLRKDVLNSVTKYLKTTSSAFM
jgi:hypothetical protein